VENVSFIGASKNWKPKDGPDAGRNTEASSSLITDEMLDRFAPRGSWAELPKKLLKKYDGLLDRVSYYFPNPDCKYRCRHPPL
jgi:hypothetical protein